MIEFLADVHQKTNDWLKFSEAKNGALIALNSALIFGVIKTVTSLEISGLGLQLYIALVLVLLFSSIVINLLSFIPRISPPWIRNTESKSSQDSTLYFGHIAKYSPSQYLQLVENKLNIKSYPVETATEYTSQIVINSQITLIKLKQFEIATWLTLASIISPVGVLLLSRIKT